MNKIARIEAAMGMQRRPSQRKRHRAAALQDAVAMVYTPLPPRGFGVRQPYAALTFAYTPAVTKPGRAGTKTESPYVVSYKILI
jgi:hypothetical protein